MILEKDSKTERCENVKHSKKLLLCISFLLITIFIGGCGFINKDDSKEKEIKKSFNKTLSMYPIKNFYTIKRGIEMKNLIKMTKEHG